ncbi:hypothetical protein COE30_21870 [Bacillus cereus]|uniref:hypothetical protein n=1 Tax=Bacillus cereus TaxID=1396 RepID=UPI000BFE7732|nr:hypothetical protein [Bacillus cereus]PGZ06206.1 hypothetical protein COE30_21870 [Bacillus cereus]
MLSPRVYWLCTHQTLRYEEVPLLIEAGTEVIPCLGDPFWLKYDSNYDNESDRLYPHWRKSCTLPTNIVEKIRRINILEKKGKLNPDETKLINQWIDVMFISNYPDILENITKWYQGYIIFRVFGHGDYTTYTKEMTNLNINIDKLVETDKYVWCPILKSLDVPEDSRITKNKFYLNAFVSSERLGFKWQGRDSKPFISTTISYLDGNPAANKIFKDFNEKFSNIPFVVLGKNSKNVVKGISEKVIGHTEDNLFYSKITESRMFVYFGLGSNYHVHYTPIEALSMGVPTVFLEKSGLAQEARANGVSNSVLKTIGMCSDTEEMKEFVLKTMNNFTELEKLADNQSSILGNIFKREEALVRAQNFFKNIQPYLVTHRKQQYNHEISLNLTQEDCFRSNSIQTDLPKVSGQRITFSTEKINSFTGKLVYDHTRKFITRRVEQGIDSPGMFIGQYIGKMQPGEYLFSFELSSSTNYNSTIGTFAIGVWSPQFIILTSQDISGIKAGKNFINLTLQISPENADLLKEIRLVWNGTHTCEISNLNVEKLT